MCDPDSGAHTQQRLLLRSSRRTREAPIRGNGHGLNAPIIVGEQQQPLSRHPRRELVNMQQLSSGAPLLTLHLQEGENSRADA